MSTRHLSEFSGYDFERTTVGNECSEPETNRNSRRSR